MQNEKRIKKSLPCVVSIAGTDPSGGAGMQADIKTISATGCYAASIITILVAQNTQGVQSIYPIAPHFVKEQIAAVFEDLDISAVKIGMLYNEEMIKLMANTFQQFKPKHIILDPVIVAKDGSLLLDLAAFDALKKDLFPLVELLTPNLFEAEKIVGFAITSFNEMEEAAKNIGEEFKINILLKGGHLNSVSAADILYDYKNKSSHWFEAQRITTNNLHGTGCSLSAAIASYLAQQYSLQEAINLAKYYLTHAIMAGSKIKIGQGYGPVDHFYSLRNSNLSK